MNIYKYFLVYNFFININFHYNLNLDKQDSVIEAVTSRFKCSLEEILAYELLEKLFLLAYACELNLKQYYTHEGNIEPNIKIDPLQKPI